MASRAAQWARQLSSAARCGAPGASRRQRLLASSSTSGSARCPFVRPLLHAHRHFASVPAALVKELRGQTGASMGKCRDALSEEGGDLEKAVEWLRKRGMRSMEKRAANSAEALLAIHVAENASSGAIVELRAETDFVTRGEAFQKLGIYLAETAANLPGGGAVEDLLQLKIKETSGRPQHLTAGTTVETALLESGSRVGERLVLGQVWSLRAPPHSLLAGYVHPKDATGLPNTGRMAALIGIQALPLQVSCDAERLHAVAMQLARHIVAAQPQFISIQSVPADVVQREKEVLRAAHLEQLGPRKAGTADEKTLSKVIQGKMQKFYGEQVLLCQEFIGPPLESSGGKAAKPPPVSEWLEVQARTLGVEKIVVEDFCLASL